MINKEEAINKICILQQELYGIEYSDDAIANEYKRWSRKLWRYIKDIFGENSQQIHELLDIDFVCHHNDYDCNSKEIFLSGKTEMQSLLESFMEEIEEWDDGSANPSKESILEIDKSKVFIVHGHDDGLKNEVARFIEKLELEVIILHELPNAGKTIIEKIEFYSNVGFGIVLYTDCDSGSKKGGELKPRARQNVIFEHGFLIGKLGREFVSHLARSNIEMPNDISGTVYVDRNNNWKNDIFKELKNAGYDVDANRIM